MSNMENNFEVVIGELISKGEVKTKLCVCEEVLM